MDFQQSKTYSNLLSSYEWEVNVSGKYLLFAGLARQDGYQEIGNIFDKVASNENEHAKIWLRKLNSGKLPSTSDNLKYCISLEDYSSNNMYRQFANTAREEGYDDIAALFNGIANIEMNHELKFQTQYNNIQNNEVFCRSQDTLWICMVCGNIMNQPCAPEICPVCGYPQGYYKIYNNNCE